MGKEIKSKFPYFHKIQKAQDWPRVAHLRAFDGWAIGGTEGIEIDLLCELNG